jgi:nuclear pore complex protein Nup107
MMMDDDNDNDVTGAASQRLDGERETVIVGTDITRLGANLTSSDREKILAMDWFDLRNAAGVYEAVKQSTHLYRLFVSSDKLTAAMLLSRRLGTRFDMLLPTDMMMMMMGGGHSRRRQHAATNYFREYRCWRAYVRCLNWHSAFLQHLHTRQQQQQQHSKSNSNSSSGKQVIDAQQKQQQDVEEAGVFRQTYECMLRTLHFDGGWMVDVQADDIVVDDVDINNSVEANSQEDVVDEDEEEPEARAAALLQIRRHCIPHLVYLLHDICFRSGRYTHSLRVADIVASEQYQLYLSFDPAELQSLLSLLRQSFLQTLAV